MEPITVLYWLCILAAPAVLLLAAVRCLYLDRGWRRNVLALILGLLVGALLLWLGGGWVLSRFGLAWRAWLASLLGGGGARLSTSRCGLLRLPRTAGPWNVLPAASGPSGGWASGGGLTATEQTGVYKIGLVLFRYSWYDSRN